MEIYWQTEIQLFKGPTGCFQLFESRTRKRDDKNNGWSRREEEEEKQKNKKEDILTEDRIQGYNKGH